MLKLLEEVLINLKSIIKNKEHDSLDICLKEPIIHRVSFEIENGNKVFLHKIHPCDHAYYHSHSWPFATQIIKGQYEMGVGQNNPGSSRVVAPPILSRYIVKEGMSYEMLSSDIWHYTRPLEITYSVMVIGPRWRERKSLNNGKLTEKQIQGILDFFCLHSSVG